MKNSKFANRKPQPKVGNVKFTTGESKKIFAKKSFGQNFLTDENYIERIIAALDPQFGETIIEIGAGRGALTEKLIDAGANVVAVELEREMISVLRKRFGDCENFKLIEADALKVDFEKIASRKSQTANFKLVANLPYNISTAILQRLIEQREIFSLLILMFQREVVERITARVGSSERGFLTILTELYLAAEKLFDVPPDAFLPAPSVWSSVIRLQPKAANDLKIDDENLFRQIVSVGFSQKRKTIFNNLRNLSIEEVKKNLLDCGIAPERRAETLTIEEWQRLTNSIAESRSKLGRD